MPPDAFISHAVEESDIAHSICSGLEARGLQCWIAPRDVPPGSAYGAEIITGIRGSSVFLLLLSTSSVASKQVEREAERASHYEKRIIPVELDTEDPGPSLEFYLAARQRFRYARDDQFLDTLAAVIRGGTTPPAADPPKPRTPSRKSSSRRAARTRASDSASLAEPQPLRDDLEDTHVQQPAAEPSPSRRIYLCSRHDDSGDVAGSLCDLLVAAYGRDAIVDHPYATPPGTDLDDHIRSEVSLCSAMLVVIGQRWLTLDDSSGRRLLDRDNDPIATEIAAALQFGLPVLPVLVEGARMPSADQLPASIRSLTDRNAISLSADRWHQDVELLTRGLRQMMEPVL